MEANFKKNLSSYTRVFIVFLWASRSKGNIKPSIV